MLISFLGQSIQREMLNHQDINSSLLAFKDITCPTHRSQPRNNRTRLYTKKKPRFVPVNMGVWTQKIGSRPNLGIIRTKFRMHNLKVCMSIFNCYGLRAMYLTIKAYHFYYSSEIPNSNEKTAATLAFRKQLVHCLSTRLCRLTSHE